MSLGVGDFSTQHQEPAGTVLIGDLVRDEQRDTKARAVIDDPVPWDYMRHLATIIETKLRPFFPEWRALPWYVLIERLKWFRGLTSRRFYWTMRSSITNDRGPGPTIALSPRAIADHYPASRRRGLFPVAALGVAGHEAIHLACEGLDLEAPADVTPNYDGAALLRTIEATGGKTLEQAVAPFAGHGPDFIRVCLHFAHRAAGLGITDADVFDAPAYGLSSTWAYVKALGNERQRLADVPLTTIAQTPPPPALVALFRSDVIRWARRHRTESPETFTAAWALARPYLTRYPV